MPLAPVQVTNTHTVSKRDSSTSADRLESNKYSVRIVIFSLTSNDMKPFIFGSDFGSNSFLNLTLTAGFQVLTFLPGTRGSG